MISYLLTYLPVTTAIMPDLAGLDYVTDCAPPRMTIRGSRPGQFNPFSSTMADAEYRRSKNAFHVTMSKGFFFNFFDDELPDRVRYSWSTTPVPIDMNCTHGVQWMWLVFQQCAVSPAEITAVVMGLISVFSWMLNGIPQIIENYKTGIPDQAVSLFLLIFWTIGDSFSLAGCLLTHQLVLQRDYPSQRLTMDGIDCSGEVKKTDGRRLLVSMVEFKNAPHFFPNDIETLLPSDSASDSEPPSSNHSQPVRTGSAASLLSITALLCVGLPCVNRTETPLATDPSLKNGPLFALSVHSTTLSPESPFYPSPIAYTGYVLGWFSSLMYLSSRFPQILQNWRRGSTEGLSIFLFMFALLGNASYGLQIFLTSTDTLFLLHSLPWILGSLGVLFLDVVAEREAKFFWGAKKRLTSSLLAIFPAAMTGKRVSVTLLDDTLVTGRLASVDGFLNLELDSGVEIVSSLDAVDPLHVDVGPQSR
ncbi:unnamed protein product [Schistocephalus solidus]|uniref:Sm domain-containing protein n=1 Tax=Schistocephalus solidus TaxID=70667 RepID=A0A183ST11_SCHSO|nr:unnamed protein product [Schistocephalus solidus]